MNDIVELYRGKRTGQGHEIRVDEGRGEMTLWCLHWGEFQGIDGHHHLGIAKVRQDDKGYWLGVLQGTAQRPDEYKAYSSESSLCAELDEIIAAR